MRILLLTLFIFCSAAVGLAQQAVQGTVVDPAGDAVIGATVLVTGTAIGTITDIDGNFELTVPEDGASLTVSYIGYDSQEIRIGDESVFNFVLSEGVALDEVVVTGYSVGTKRDATGAIATIDAEDLQAIPSSNVEQQLQGRAAGVTVITNGQPGTGSKVRIRGFGSFNANQPLYVVDGVPTQDVSFLSPDDIATTSILKDASSASIYGSRASSGVIVYTTKKGKQGQGVRISYDGLIGVTTKGTGQPVLSPQEQADYTLRALQNETRWLGERVDTTEYTHPQYGTVVGGSDGSFQVPDFIRVGNLNGVAAEDVDLAAEAELYSENPNSPYIVTRSNRAGTDWYDAISQNALLNRHALGFSGGTDASRFYVGLSAQDQDGILINQSFKRYAIRANSEFEIGDRVRIGENMQVTYNSTLGLIGGSGGQNVSREETDVLLAFRIAPAIPVRNEFGGYAGTGAQGFGNPSNPVANREQQADNTNRNIGTFGNVYAEVDIIDGLFFRTVAGGQYNAFAGRGFGRATYENAENNANRSYSEFNGTGYQWVFTNTLNFDYDIADVHSIKGLVGYEALSLGNSYSTNSRGINPFVSDPNFVNINQVQNPVTQSRFDVPRRYASVLGQVQYNYDSRYYITGVVRQDKSSAFVEDIRSGVFPAVSAAWRVTGESFLAPSNTLSDLKVRAGYGIMGNADAVPSTNRFNLFGGDITNAAYPINGNNSAAAPGFRQSRIGNPNARWEEAVTTNVGVEATLFNSKIDFIVDLWQRENRDVLVAPSLLDVYGRASVPFVNVGAIDNRGIDLQLTYRDNITGDLSFEATVTGSFLKNEIKRLAPTIDFFEPDAPTGRQAGPVRNLVGKPISSFFGYETAGLWQTQAEVDAANAAAPEDSEGNRQFQSGAAPGRFRFVDNNGFNEANELTGVPDGKIDAADRTFIGSPVPTFTGGVNLYVKYKGFDLETFIYASAGNDIYNFSKWYTDFFASFAGAAISERVKDSWTPENGTNEQPIFENVSNFSTNQEVNSFYVEDGSYLRMRNLTLGYTVPNELFGGVFTRARVYASANNLFTLTKYTGIDPQVGGAADTDFGIDIGNFPVTRTYNFGVGLSF